MLNKPDRKETMFIHCMDIYLELYSAVSKDRVLLLQILFSLRILPLYSTFHTDWHRRVSSSTQLKILTENRHTSILKQIDFPLSFYGFLLLHKLFSDHGSKSISEEAHWKSENLISQSSFLSPEENRWCTHFSLDYLQVSLAVSLSSAVYKLWHDQQKAASQGSCCIWQEHLTV